MEDSQKATPTTSYNKVAYGIFVLAGISFLITKDASNAVIFWGLALIFDPFDINQPWKERPLYQKVWLIVHLAITFAVFGFLIAG